MHLMRWSAASENWHRIHYDESFSKQHDKLPERLVNGSLKQNFIFEALRRWAGNSGWVWKVKFQFRQMDVVNTSLAVWGKVRGKIAVNADYGLITLDVGIVNEDQRESTPGAAIVALPLEGGKVPYPFVPPAKLPSVS
jgi:hypothetical protein